MTERNKKVTALVTEEEMQQMKAVAGMAGVSISEYIRGMIVKEYSKLNVK